MCGFAGYKTEEHKKIDPTILSEMSQVIAHRGPDDDGIWRSEDLKTALISRRLSIIDTSHAGHQPMIDESQDVVLAFNGEIYNHNALRDELRQSGFHFRSQSDTEVVLYAYKRWGINFLEKLDGMFAGVIYDQRSQELFLFRDRMGIKPLYFSLQGSILSFASEIKALWKCSWIARRISARGLSHYLTYLATPAPMTLFEGIYKLPAGYYACYKNGGYHLRNGITH